MKHLAAKESGWKHTVVAWTGEIKEVSAETELMPNQHLQNPRTNVPGILALNKPKVPPPVPIIDGTADRMSMKGDYSKPPAEEKPKLGEKERVALQKVLDGRAPEAGWQSIKPVWMGDEEDGRLPLGETDVARWRQYAERGKPIIHPSPPMAFLT